MAPTARANFPNRTHSHRRRALHAHERVIEGCAERFHRVSHEMRATIGVESDVVALSLDPVDAVEWNDVRARACADHEAGRRAGWCVFRVGIGCRWTTDVRRGRLPV